MASSRIRRRKAPPGLDRKGFRVAEESFFDRLQANLNSMPGIYNPVDNRTYDASPRNRVTKMIDDRSTEVKKLIKALAERDLMRTYEEMPKNNILLVEITHKELLSSKSIKVAVAAASFSPSEDLIRQGRSLKRAGAAELNRVKDLIVGHPHVFYFIGAFCPTGWEEGCKHLLVGGNYLVALLDIYGGAWRTYFAPDARWRSSARLFDVTTDEEKIEAIRVFVQRHTAELLMDELTEDLVFEELGYSIPIIREAFEMLAAEDRFVRFDTGTRPFRLVRSYG